MSSNVGLSRRVYFHFISLQIVAFKPNQVQNPGHTISLTSSYSLSLYLHRLFTYSPLDLPTMFTHSSVCIIPRLFAVAQQYVYLPLYINPTNQMPKLVAESVKMCKTLLSVLQFAGVCTSHTSGPLTTQTSAVEFVNRPNNRLMASTWLLLCSAWLLLFLEMWRALHRSNKEFVVHFSSRLKQDS